MAANRFIRDFTTGPVWGPLVRFSVPFMLSNALQVLYSTVDMFIVGQVVGKDGLAAVTNASRICTFLTMVCLGLATSGQVYIAQLLGQGRKKDLNDSIGTLFSFLALIGLGMSALGIVFARPILDLLQVPREAYGGAMSYLVVCSAGLVFTYGYNMVSAVLRGMGDSRHPFVFIAIASVANILLDILFIAGFGWGCFGAALATILGQAISFAYAAAYLYRHRDEFCFDFRRESFRIRQRVLSAMLRLGLPFVVRFAAVNVSMLYVIRLVNGVGIAASTVFGVGVQLDDLVTKVTQGIMMAVTGMVGQNFGAGKPDRIRKIVAYSWLFALGFYCVFTAFLLGMPEGLFGIFTNDPEVLALAPLFAWTIVWQFPGLILMRGTNGFLNGIGAARLALVFAVLDGVLLRIGCSWLFGTVLGWGLRGFIFGYAIACYGMALPALVYFFFFPWHRRRAATA